MQWRYGTWRGAAIFEIDDASKSLLRAAMP